MDKWEKRAQFTSFFGYVFNVSLVYFLVLAIMGGTLQSQFSHQDSVVLATTTCPIPLEIDSKIVLTVDASERTIDCRSSDITIKKNGTLEFHVENFSELGSQEVTFFVKNLIVEADAQLLIKNQIESQTFTIKAAHNVIVHGELIVSSTDSESTDSLSGKLGIEGNSLTGAGIISSLNGEIRLACTQPNRFLGSYLVGTGNIEYKHCSETLVDLPSGLLDELQQVSYVSPSTSSSDVYLQRVAAVFHQIDTNTSGIAQNPIAPGGYIANRDIIFAASISKLATNNFSDETLQMQVELKRATDPFDGLTGLYTSESVQVKKNEQKTVTVPVHDLIVGVGYKWRIRTLNPVTSTVSNWEDFGDNDSNAPDFIVTSAAGLQLDLDKSTFDLSETASITVSIKTSAGDLDPTYTGTIHFQSSSDAIQLPNDYTFTAADKGQHVFKSGIKPFDVGRFVITVEDKQNGMLVDSTTFTSNVPNISYLYIGTSAKVTTAVAPITLSWMSNKVLHLSVNNQRMETTASGSYVVTPEKDTTYFVNGADVTGKTISTGVDVVVDENTSSITQNELQSCPVLESFTVNKTLIKKGESVAIAWSVSNGQNITVDAFGSRLASQGSAVVELQRSQDVTLWVKTGTCIKTLVRHVTVVDFYPWEGPIGILIGGILLETVALYLGAVQSNMWLPLVNFINRLRKKRSSGVVYDVETKLGVSGIVVRLWNKSTGKLEDTSITNDQGIFAFAVRPGIYVIKIVDSAYEMLEKENNSHANEYAYPYYGEVVTFEYEDAPFMVSVPVHHVKKNKKINRQLSRPKIFFGELLTIFAPLLTLVGFLYSVAVVLLYPSWFTYIVLGAYLVVITLKAYVLLLENRHVGHVYGIDGKEIGGVKLEIVDPENQEVLASTYTNKQGRYSLFIPNKSVMLRLSHSGYKLLNRNATKNGLPFEKEGGNSSVRVFTENVLVYQNHEDAKKLKPDAKKSGKHKNLPVSEVSESQL